MSAPLISDATLATVRRVAARTLRDRCTIQRATAGGAWTVIASDVPCRVRSTGGVGGFGAIPPLADDPSATVMLPLDQAVIPPDRIAIVGGVTFEVLSAPHPGTYSGYRQAVCAEVRVAGETG